MASELTLIGGGGHALVVARSLMRGGAGGLRVLDDDPACVAVARLGLAWAGRIEMASPRAPGKGVMAAILCVGTLATRVRIVEAMGEQVRWVSVIDATAVVDGGAVGVGTYVGVRAVVQPLAVVGSHCIINTGAIVEHECELGQHVHVAPGCVMGGNVRVGAGTLLGLGSRILPGIRIGRGCTIGAGATVTRDVPDGATVVGVPARVR